MSLGNWFIYLAVSKNYTISRRSTNSKY